MNETNKKIIRIIESFDLSSDLINELKDEYDFNEILALVHKISDMYEEKINKDIESGKLDIRKKEIVLDIFEKHLDKIIKDN